MHFNLGRSRMAKTPTQSQSSSSTCSQKVKLRVIYKNRGSRQDLNEQIDNKQQPRNRIQTIDRNLRQGRLSTSLNFEADSRLALNRNPSQTISKNTIRKLQTLNAQEQLATNKQQNKNTYRQIMKRLDELDNEADQLIQTKIMKIAKRSSSITLKDKGKDQLTLKIQVLINKINNLKSENVEKLNISQQQIKRFMQRKIKLLQKLMAGKSTQSEVLKRYFFAISAISQQSNKQKKKSKLHTQITELLKDKKSMIPPIKFHIERSKTEGKQSIFKQSANKQSYIAPKANQYQTYRYKAKGYSANTQPFPRSSYNRQFLHYDPFNQKMSCKNVDNHAFLKQAKLQPSTYAKDFQKTKAGIIDYKELDSYRNKFKNIQISYALNNKKQQSQKYINQSRRYIAEQLKMKYNTKHLPKQSLKIYDTPKSLSNSFNNRSFLITTQAQRQFIGHQDFNVSSIKHQNLNNLKYSYKNLVNN